MKNRNIIFTTILLAIACFALSPTAQAVVPAPDGGYPNQNTAEGENALFSLTTGDGNTASGYLALYTDTTGAHNTAIGWLALFGNTIGFGNNAVGAIALGSNTTGSFNTAIGDATLDLNTDGFLNTAGGVAALHGNTSGDNNTAFGEEALFGNTTGSNNIALGPRAGALLTTGDNNIDIGNAGFAAEASTIRIGTLGTHTATYIAGINGVGVTGVAVKVNAAGKLGVGVSSQRFKDEIRPMDNASEVILALKPVSFRYKKEIDPERAPQFGLVAEEVEKVNPDLVVRDAEGKPYTVRYETVNAMLLNEFLKEHQTVQELKSAAAKQEAMIARQQKQIDALTAGLQKVSAQLELSKAAPEVAGNNH